MTDVEKKYAQFLKLNLNNSDSAHDLAHIKRVVANAKKLLKDEDADPEIVIAAAWLHDCVILPKNHPDRKKASVLAAKRSVRFLKKTGFPKDKLHGVSHAIEAHSFSGGIKPETIEAKIVQDADRLDALGAIGIARCFAVSGHLNRPISHPDDPFCAERNPDDSIWTVDHFYTKLFLLPDNIHTKSAKKEAEKRVAYMKNFLRTLEYEISGL